MPFGVPVVVIDTIEPSAFVTVVVVVPSGFVTTLVVVLLELESELLPPAELVSLVVAPVLLGGALLAAGAGGGKVTGLMPLMLPLMCKFSSSNRPRHSSPQHLTID